MGKIVGIDLGTTNSVIAIMEAGKPTVIPNSEGFRTTPSIVAYTKTGEKLVGQIAKRQAVLNPENTFYSVKRFIGRKSSEVSDELKQVSYTVKTDSQGNIKVDCPTLKRDYTPEELSAEVLRKLCDDASKYIGESVKQAVITVPAYFNDSQRQATRNAGQIAGLEVLRILNEPTAAALAYGFEKKNNETILIFDLGGGTFDVSILEIGDGVFEVLATTGDTHLGGDDFDDKIVKWLLSEFKSKNKVDLRTDRQALQRITEASEKAKIELSTLTQTEINIPFITAVETGPLHLEATLTRVKFEELASSLVDRVRPPVTSALKDAKLNLEKLNEVVLVGGSTRIPAIKELVKTLLNKEPNQTVNPDEVVAVGAAIQAGILSGQVKGLVLVDVTPLSLGVEILGGITSRIINRNTSIPVKKSRTFTTSTDNQDSVDVHVLQGEREFAKDNKSLGTFRLDGILPAPRGVPKIEVTFNIDANGILSVTAKDVGTGREQSITISGASTLPPDEVERLVRESEENAVADKERRDRIDLKNQSDSMCYQAEKQLDELGTKVPDAEKEPIRVLIGKLRAAIQSDSYDDMQSLSKDLQNSLMELGKKIYTAGEAPSNRQEDKPDGDNGTVEVS